MNQVAVRTAAEKASKLVASIKEGEFRNAAFGVVFSRFLGNVNDPPMSKRRSKDQLQHEDVNRARPGKSGPKDRLREVASDGFFKTGRTLTATLNELSDRGYAYDAAIVGKGLQRLCQERVLRRKKGKEGKDGNRAVYLYTNW